MDFVGVETGALFCFVFMGSPFAARQGLNPKASRIGRRKKE
jgi:hypothetical protein